MTTPAPAKAHPAVVTAAVLLVALVCGIGAVEWLSQVARATLERTSTIAPATDRFVLDADVGDITLTPSADGQVHVRTVVHHGLGEPELVEESTPTGVRLDVDCDAPLADDCDVQYVVEVPPAFEVRVEGVAGDVTASRLTGSVTIDRRVGDIAVFDMAGPVDLGTSTGEITAEGLRSEVVRAVSDTGDVRLELLAAPRSLDARSETGEIDLAVPGDVGYRVDARTRSGDERVLVPVDPASPRIIRAEGSSGDVSLRPSR
ncbi:DUF4097 family beta strand repeat-containing protein [Pseudonocardia kunmingensis]|uniref:Putative adhesin n=1 Tax=Pseudonocardia kunmingensis TaxID=630975 RepID=A0A543DXK4_9PSEU|nr:DUF4097 family beta strand repeat-containing protein [Pseudonocardia kunmingensis]TQM14067.1 putative adhesin [Pseudonocardia kunmingensis]